MIPKDITGQKFGHLTAIRYDHTGKGRKHYWLFKCDCGKEHIAGKTNVVCGSVKSCGCMNGGYKHGLVGKRIYKIWQDIKIRCTNPKHNSYKNYGGRGIKMCDSWAKSPESFCEWSKNNGYKEDLSIDRIDVNGNYCPENCRWISNKEQKRNMRTNRIVEIDGVKRCFSEWSEIYGIKKSTVHERLYRGWDIEKAFKIKPDKRFANK